MADSTATDEDRIEGTLDYRKEAERHIAIIKKEAHLHVSAREQIFLHMAMAFHCDLARIADYLALSTIHDGSVNFLNLISGIKQQHQEGERE